jgi:tRNA A-37 threonylcarbamoyl transferase component Bud32
VPLAAGTAATPVEPAQNMDLTGQTVARYRIVSKLGAGGMGVVYLAEDTELGRKVALKFLPHGDELDPHALERFRVEARAASGLNHPCICTVYDIGEFEDTPYIVMEALDGEALGTKHRGQPMRIDDLIEIGIQLADALDAAHAHGIIHRDVKPANIFLDPRNRAKLLDFGLAKLAPGPAPAVTGLDTTSRSMRHGHQDNRLTQPGTAMGTVSYMSPEQARGEDVDARTDLFSLGAVLYEMATGTRAFQGSTAAVIYDAILNRTPTPVARQNPLLPDHLDGIIAKALEKNRDLRYQHASELRADLRRVQRDLDLLSGTRRLDSVYLGAVEPRQGTGASPASPATRARGRWLGAAAVAAAAVVAVIWALVPVDRNPPAGGGTPAGESAGTSGDAAATAAGTSPVAPATGILPDVASLAPPAPARGPEPTTTPEPVAPTPAVPSPARAASAPAPAAGDAPTSTASAVERAPAIDNRPDIAAGAAPVPAARPASQEIPATPDVAPTVAERPVEEGPPVNPAPPAPEPARLDAGASPATVAQPPVTAAPGAAPPAADPVADPAQAPVAVADAPSDEALIRDVLRDYERAIETRDIALYRSVVPGLTSAEERALLDSFRNVEAEVDIRVDSLVVEGDTATVRVTRRDVARTRDGRQAPAGTSTPTFRFERSARGWVITRVTAN